MVVKKKAAKKTAARSSTHRPGVAAAAATLPRPDPLRVPDETFEAQEEATRLPAGQVAVIVNGTPRGTVSCRGRKLGEFVQQQAQQYGVRRFTVYVDGKKISRDAVGAALDGDPQIGKVEIVAKDSRAAGL